MKALFDTVSSNCSKLVTKSYSTSFSLAILFLDKRMRSPIYSIYGFVRLADEIVDSFHGYDKKELLQNLRTATNDALRDRISLNPILNSFQHVVHEYNISKEWIDVFLDSMAMDLYKQDYSEEEYKKYILGSAESVGLMCLHVFTEKNEKLFQELKPYAMKLGAAFQKVNFLRDMNTDKTELGRVYFPNINFKNFCSEAKQKIEKEIEEDFSEALTGIRLLPRSSRNGVYLGYYYYMSLFNKIKRLPPKQLLYKRIRIPNFHKLILMVQSNVRHQLNLL